MEEYLNNMTLIYSKKTGNIYTATIGFQGVSIFGDFEEEVKDIFDEVTVPYDELVFKNNGSFVVDLETKEVCMKNKIATYRVL